MATPKYFKNLPDLKYAVSVNKAGQPSYLTVKDYFQLSRVRDDIYREETVYTEYVVKDGERPDQISYEIYGDNQYYWVILQINDITDYYSQWPLSRKEMDEYIVKKYGVNGGEEIHHYETVETYDQDENLVLPGGLNVPSTFVHTYRASADSNAFLTSLPVAVTNADYEERVNEEKSSIYILQKKYIYDYVREVKNAGLNAMAKESQVSINDVI